MRDGKNLEGGFQSPPDRIGLTYMYIVVYMPPLHYIHHTHFIHEYSNYININTNEICELLQKWLSWKNTYVSTSA